jgi:predicted nuclease of predicted toxin-antitoxin system
MNLSPGWITFFVHHGWEAVHWSTIGDPRATDRAIMEWALANGYTVFTHDLDFGAILAATQASAPSVLQVRAHDVLPAHLGGIVAAAIRQFAGNSRTVPYLRSMNAPLASVFCQSGVEAVRWRMKDGGVPCP